MALVPAICSQCGGKILVDDTHEAGICEYCGTAFITEKVINNYQNTINVENATINVSGLDAENLLLRAKAFEAENNQEKAIEYYNKVLDIDINNVEANEGLKRVAYRFIGNLPVSLEVSQEIETLMAKGEKIQAIKLVRGTAGLGLATAKYFVENHTPGDWSAYDLDKAAYGTSTSSNNGGCYVATAVYGSYNCPQVWTLRRYRDNTLAKTWYGRAFIHSYYAVSPTLVKWFGQTEWFKALWKPRLDKMVQRLNDEGIKNTPYNDKQW